MYLVELDFAYLILQDKLEGVQYCPVQLILWHPVIAPVVTQVRIVHELSPNFHNTRLLNVHRDIILILIILRIISEIK